MTLFPPDADRTASRPVFRQAAPVSLRLWGGGALLAFCVCAVLGALWEEQLPRRPSAVLLRGASREESILSRGDRGGIPSGAKVFQKIGEKDGLITADYGFLNFNSDQLLLRFSILAGDLAVYKSDYGFTAAEKAAIDQWQQQACDEACRHAMENRRSQEQLDRAVAAVAVEYRARLLAFYRSRGFAVLEGNILMADIPGIVRRNTERLRAVALALEGEGKRRGYDSDSTLAAALSLVQTALVYQNVPQVIDGRQTGGIYPPLESLSRGKGDCDSKTALLAAILLNWDRISLVGVGVPGHYLMGVLRNPAKGECYVEYDGLPYVLLEPAGPGWLPLGTIDKGTAALLNAVDKLQVEPFSAN